MGNAATRKANKAQIKAWKRRWDVAEEARIAELRATSMEEKLRQVASLMVLARALDGEKSREAEMREIREIRERWRKIHEAYAADK